ncbi:unnamed protein product [Malus baccata var. baccata]
MIQNFCARALKKNIPQTKKHCVRLTTHPQSKYFLNSSLISHIQDLTICPVFDGRIFNPQLLLNL